MHKITLKTLLLLDWRAFTRNNSELWKAYVIMQLVHTIFWLLNIIFLIGFSWLLPTFIKHFKADPTTEVSQYLFIYIFVDFVMRLLMQKLQSSQIAYCMHLPIKKRTLCNYIIIKFGFNIINLIALSFGIMFPLSNFGFGFIAFFWFLSVMSWILINNFIVFSIKLRLKNIIFSAVTYFILFVILYFSSNNLNIYETVLIKVSQNQYLYILFPVLTLVIFVNKSYLLLTNEFYRFTEL